VLRKASAGGRNAPRPSAKKEMTVRVESKEAPPRGEPHAPARRAIERMGWGAALGASGIALLWGSNVVALKYGLATFPPLWSALWRMAVSGVAVGLWARYRHVAIMPAAGEWRGLGLLCLLFTVQIATFNWGVNLTSPGYAIVLLNVNPIFANLIAHFVVPEDRITWQRIVGLFIAFGGICAVFLGQPDAHLAPEPLWGNLITMVSGFLLALRIVYTQQLVQRIHPVRAVLWQTLLSIPGFLLLAALLEPPLLQPVNWKAVAAIVHQGAIIAGFCFVAWTVLLQRYSPGTLQAFAFSSPIFGVILSALFMGETITPRLILGVAAVTAGILIVMRYQAGRAVPRPPLRETASR